MAVHGVIAQSEIVILTDLSRSPFIREQRGKIGIGIPSSDIVVHMPRIDAVFWRPIKGIDEFKSWIGSIQPSSIDSNVPVIADTDCFVTQCDESLDVMSVLRQPRNAG